MSVTRVIAAVAVASLASGVTPAAENSLVEAEWQPSADGKGCALTTVFKGKSGPLVIRFMAGPRQGQPLQLLVLADESITDIVTLESPSMGALEVTRGPEAPNQGPLIERLKRDIGSGKTWRVRMKREDHSWVEQSFGSAGGEIAVRLFDGCIAARLAEPAMAPSEKWTPSLVDVFGSEDSCTLVAYFAPELEPETWHLVIRGQRGGASMKIWSRTGTISGRPVPFIDLSGLEGPRTVDYDEPIELDEEATTKLQRSLSRLELIAVPIKAGESQVASLRIGGPEMRLSLAMFNACWAKLRP